ncbi:MAG: MMPL family transporter [Candidatus Neomarinimicrobiota bacterium]
MRQRLLTTLGRWAGEKTWWMLLFVLVLTLVFGGLSEQLEMTMDLTGLLPKDDPMVDEFNYIFEEFNGASNIFVVVQGEMADMVRFAEEISPQIRDVEGWIDANGSEKVQGQLKTARDKAAVGKIVSLDYYIERVEYTQPTEFIRNHGLMLIKPKDLKNTIDIYNDPNLLPLLTNLNNSLEKEYIQSDEKISTTQREQSATMFLDGIESWVDHTELALYSADYDPVRGALAADAVAIGNPYLVSPDRSLLLITVEPTFSIMDMDYLMPFVNGLEELVKTAAGDYNVDAGLAGALVLGRDEMVAGVEDSMSLTILALILILILFVVTFRMVSAPVLAILNLIIGIIWAMGVSWILVQTLNMFTAMMAVVLVGLGIDFSIHIISVYSELVNRGEDPKQAIIATMQKVGSGIITGGLTTAAAFLTLMVSRSAGMSEFGLVSGVGLIVIMIATLLAMPTMLMLRERYRVWRGKELKQTSDVAYARVGKIGAGIHRKWRFSLITTILVTVFFAFMMGRVTFDYNYLNMEPEGLESIALNDLIIEKFNFSSDATMMTATSLDQNHEYTEAAKKKSSVSYVESLSDYLPVAGEQEKRKAGILQIAGTMGRTAVALTVSDDEYGRIIEELSRLEANVIEMQDMAFTGGQDLVDQKAMRIVGNPDRPELAGNLSRFIARMEEEPVRLERLGKFNQDFGRAYRSLVLDMADTTTITLEMLPAVIRSKHINATGDRFLLTLYPKGDVWNIDYLEVFTREVLDISSSISGTPPMFYYLLKIIGADGRRASLLTIAVVLLFLWLDFRSLKKALLAMIPLFFGVIWMVGVMGLTGIQLTLLNIMAIPLIIGIGIDDGVHVIHRYHYEGRGSIFTVYSSTGKAIIITSLTTMLAFGSLVFATYRGFGSLGLALFLGVGTCLLASVLVLPALLALIEKKK